MKKIIGILGIGILILTFSSCKKEYTCHCTIYFENGANLKGSDLVHAKSVTDASQECDAIGEKDASVQSEAVKSVDCHL